MHSQQKTADACSKCSLALIQIRGDRLHEREMGSVCTAKNCSLLPAVPYGRNVYEKMCMREGRRRNERAKRQKQPPPSQTTAAATASFSVCMTQVQARLSFCLSRTQDLSFSQE